MDYTRGIELPGDGSNRLTRCHIWGGPLPLRTAGELPKMLIDSANYVFSSYNEIDD